MIDVDVDVESVISLFIKTMGEDLNSLILYGSYARGEQTEFSDIDIAVILSSGYNKTAYKKALDFVAEKELECGKVLSVIDIDNDKYNEWKDTVPFYKNLEKEGIVLWEADKKNKYIKV